MRKLLTILLSLMIIITSFSGISLTVIAEDATYGGGNGTSWSDPYIISNETHFNNIRNNPTAYFLIENDIDLTLLSPVYEPFDFSGYIKGASQDTNNLIKIKVNITSGVTTGLFSTLDNAMVSYLEVTGTINCTGTSNLNGTGSFAGKATGTTTISNCISRAEVSGSHSGVGGLVGYLSGDTGKIENCINYGDVTTNTAARAANYVGGIAGKAESLILNCINEATIEGNCAGGIVGLGSNTIKECSNKGIVRYIETTERTDKIKLGGIAGVLNNGGTVEQCVNSSEAKVTVTMPNDIVNTTESYLGGIVGFNDSVTNIINKCSNYGTVSKASNSYCGGIVGYHQGSNINNCANYSNNVIGKQMGGITGVTRTTGSITNSFNTGNIATPNVSYIGGGITGQLYGSLSSINNCFNIGIINANVARVAGIEGTNTSGGAITNSYTVIGTTNSRGAVANHNVSDTAYYILIEPGTIISGYGINGTETTVKDIVKLKVSGITAENGWTVLPINENNKYPLPQLLSNPYYGEYSISDITPPCEVSNLSLTPGEGEILISFTEPDDSDYEKTNVYIDGELHTSLLKGTCSHIITGLLGLTDYTIKITTVDETENESIGVTNTIKTQFAPAPPTNVNYTNTLGQYNLTFTESVDAAVTSYDAYIYTGDTMPETATIKGITSGINITSYLTQATIYNIVITAMVNDVIFASSMTVQVDARFKCGTGIEGDPYIIETLEHLNNVANASDKVFKQIADINEEFTTPIPSFTGTYDGQDYEIKLNINKTEEDNVGLFATVSGDAKLKNIKTTGTVIGNSNTGAIVGSTTATANGEMTDCKNYATIEGFHQTGGIIGTGTGSKVVLSSLKNFGEVKGGNYVGGIIGLGGGGVIEKCANFGYVYSNGSEGGGICGRSNADVKTSYNMGNIDLNSTGGGIVGGIRGGSIFDCYNLGIIKGNGATGIATYPPYKITSNIKNCYNLGEVVRKDDKQLLFEISSGNDQPTVTITNCYMLSADTTINAGENVTVLNLEGLSYLNMGASFNNAEPDSETYKYPTIIGNTQANSYILKTLNITAGENGSVNRVGTKYVKSGSTYTVIIIPSSNNYIIDSILFNGEEKDGDIVGEYTYTTPIITDDATLSISFTERPITPIEQIVINTPINAFIPDVVVGEKFTNQYGVDQFEIKEGERYAVTLSIVNEYYGWRLEEWGVVLNGTSYPAEIELTEEGKFGILFEGIGLGTNVLKAYAIYTDGTNQITVYNESKDLEIK